MKSTLSHLPDDKQEELETLTKIIVEKVLRFEFTLPITQVHAWNDRLGNRGGLGQGL